MCQQASRKVFMAVSQTKCPEASAAAGPHERLARLLHHVVVTSDGLRRRDRQPLASEQSCSTLPPGFQSQVQKCFFLSTQRTSSSSHNQTPSDPDMREKPFAVRCARSRLERDLTLRSRKLLRDGECGGKTTKNRRPLPRGLADKLSFWYMST